MPGVVGVFTAEDLGVTAAMPNPHPHPLLEGSVQAPPLAFEEVCYVGQAVAVVVAENRYAAADAAESVWVEFEPLPAVAHVEAAIEPGAPPVHRGGSTNLVTTLSAAYGDVAGAFGRADVVIPLELRQHRGACASMEPRGVLAHEVDGRLNLWSSTQAPYPVRRRVAEYFGRDDVRVIAPDVGGGFGPKGGIYPEEYVLAALAAKLDAPVKWIETRREHLLTTQQQRDMVAFLEVAASADGRLLGLRGRLLHDNGAYVPYGLLLPMTGFQLIQGPYTLQAMDLTLEVVYTNAVPTSPIRGAARPNATFIHERVIDAVARALGMDIAAYVEDTGLGPHEQARVQIEADGTVTVVLGANSQGQGHATVLAQICATELGVDATSVVVKAGDTDQPGNGVPTVASRTAVNAGSSTHLAAVETASILKRLAAEHLEAAEADLILEDGEVRVVGQPDAGVGFAQLAAIAASRGEEAAATEAFPTPRPPYAFGCHVAEVEVDRETGLVTVVHYSVAHDCGTVLNPMIVDGQIDGGVAHGLSNALLERVVYAEDGQPLTTTFMDFRIPTAMEMPPLSKVHTVTPAPDNPLGAKGAGEGGTIPAMAAVAAAVEDALSHLGVVVDRYPLTPEVVRGMILEAAGG